MIFNSRPVMTAANLICRLLILGVMLTVLVACRAHPTASHERFPTLAPADGSQSYDACAYILSYPPDLELYVLPSEDVVLTSPQDEAVHITFSARELEEDDAHKSASSLLVALIEEVDASASWAYSPAPVVDAEGMKLDGLQADGISEGLHWRLFTVISTGTYFWDTVPTTVAYSMRAQVPEESWERWRSSLESMIATFQPISCGPY
jgi:hypothetical protein